MQNSINGRLWINKSEHNFLGQGRMELLMHIEQEGSITKAAKAMKMSYKAAWDAVDAMNNLSEFPLVASAKGGKGAWSTRQHSNDRICVLRWVGHGQPRDRARIFSCRRSGQSIARDL